MDTGGRVGGASAISTLIRVLRSWVCNRSLSVEVNRVLVCHPCSERATLSSNWCTAELLYLLSLLTCFFDRRSMYE